LGLRGSKAQLWTPEVEKRIVEADPFEVRNLSFESIELEDTWDESGSRCSICITLQFGSHTVVVHFRKTREESRLGSEDRKHLAVRLQEAQRLSSARIHHTFFCLMSFSAVLFSQYKSIWSKPILNREGKHPAVGPAAMTCNFGTAKPTEFYTASLPHGWQGDANILCFRLRQEVL
jgi:hypothetical protein